MGITVGWHDDARRLIRVTVEGRWSFDELEASLRETIAMMDTASEKVDFLIDIRRGHLDMASALGQAQKVATPETHRNEGLKVVVGAGRLVKMLYPTYRKMTQAMGKDQEFHFADSVEDALALIDARR